MSSILTNKPVTGGRAGSSSGPSIAAWMLVGGLLALVLGAIFYAANQDYYGSTGWMYFGISLGVTGGQVAMLGLHAMAVRQE